MVKTSFSKYLKIKTSSGATIISAILRETESSIVTPSYETFAMYDRSQVNKKKNEVVWDKATGLRKGEAPPEPYETPAFKFIEVLDQFPDVICNNTYVV